MKLDIEVTTKMKLEFLKEIERPIGTIEEGLKNMIREFLEFELLDDDVIGTIDVEVNKFEVTK